MSDVKPTNPKDGAAVHKLPLDLVPASLKVFATLAFAEGAAKYGAYNWRVSGVRASIYKAALERHLESWWNGEDADPQTGVPHLASMLACAGILLDADLAQKLNDDRPPHVAMGDLIRGLEGDIQRIRALFSDRTPQHCTHSVQAAPSAGV